MIRTHQTILKIKVANMFKFLTVLTSVLFFAACADGDLNESGSDDFLIIGLTFGECGGDCAHLYKLEAGELYADMEATWWNPSDNPSFNSSSLDEADALEEMEGLRATFPDYLLDTEETSFGCPDCGDWGALHVFMQVDGEVRYWTLDNAIESNPEEIQVWTKRMQMLLYDLIK